MIPPTFEHQPKIFVIGFGGDGLRAIEHMIRATDVGIEFIAVDDDPETLRRSRAGYKVLASGKEGDANTHMLSANQGVRLSDEQALSIACALQGAHYVFIVGAAGSGVDATSLALADLVMKRRLVTFGVFIEPNDPSDSVAAADIRASLNRWQERLETIILISIRDRNEAAPLFGRCVRLMVDFYISPQVMNVDIFDVFEMLGGCVDIRMGSGSACGVNRGVTAMREAIASFERSNFLLSNAKAIFVSITGSGYGYGPMAEALDVLVASIPEECEVIHYVVADGTMNDELHVTFLAVSAFATWKPVSVTP